MSITVLLIIITCIISYYAQPRTANFIQLQHSPFVETRNKQYYRMLTSGFVHGGWVHLFINMFVLYDFGQTVENQFIIYFGETMGRLNYLLLYLVTIVVANCGTLIKHRDNPQFASVGASGAVSGILFVYIIFYPWNLLLIMFIIPCPAILASILFLVYSSWAAKNSQDFIDHDAHFYGAVFGFIFAVALKPSFFNLFLHNLIS